MNLIPDVPIAITALHFAGLGVLVTRAAVVRWRRRTLLRQERPDAPDYPLRLTARKA